jgi:hypothetical protein
MPRLCVNGMPVISSTIYHTVSQQSPPRDLGEIRTCVKPKSARRGLPHVSIIMFAWSYSDENDAVTTEKPGLTPLRSPCNTGGFIVCNTRSPSAIPRICVFGGSRHELGKLEKGKYQCPVISIGPFPFHVIDRIAVLLPWTDHVTSNKSMRTNITEQRNDLRIRPIVLTKPVEGKNMFPAVNSPDITPDFNFPHETLY